MTDLLQDNLLYLHKHKQELFKQIELYLDNNQEEKLFKLIWDDGFPNVTFSNDNGIKLIYDKDGSDLSEWIKDYQFLQDGQYDIVMFGLGMTYHLVRLLEMNTKLSFYIIEPEVDLFVEILKVININQLLEHPQIKLLHVGNGALGIEKFIYLKNLYSNNNRVNICLPFYTAINQEYVRSYYEEEYKALTREAIEAGLEYNFGTLQYKNSIKNIEYLYRSNGLELLKGKYRNCTALVVGGGPSLEKDIEMVKASKEKLLIIAAGSSIQALLRNGIEPHLIVSMDPSEANGKVFENVNTTHIPLVFINQLYPPILESHPNCNFHAFFNSDHILDYFFAGRKLEPKIMSTTSVSGTAVQIAVYLGASTIIFTGQDLSFPNKRYYAFGATHLSTEILDENMSMNTVKVENVNGDYNDTNYSFKVTLEDIEELIGLLDNVKFINSSSLGAKIKGADYLPFEEAIASLKEKEYDFDLIQKIGEQTKVENSFTLDELMSRITNVEDAYEFITKKCEASIRLIKKIDELSRTQPNKAMSTLVKLEKEFSQVTEHSMFKLIIPFWNRGLTRKYDQQVGHIEKEPSMIGKAKLLNEIVIPYISTLLDSFFEINEEFQQLKTRLYLNKEEENVE
ncbi:MAG: DUF115 domain-containing protein [Candidatus Pristimantibacillus lignocellulolyticus]|uniref:DUF115 domain-containing protein n=1 Tax=Candidatus Pristimantibacillus lignocellulolyticus TaxID=2994561 RepID=A0A9J6ZIT2_9BACL|nr:MAG: DUF115 domain-containing protein [Candidatus Pristimantibacillus lignocellulolyticus]